MVLTIAAGSVLLKDDETDIMTGKPVEETGHDDSVYYLVKEIQNYDPDYTYPHDNDEAGVNFLANLLHYEKLEYYNKHHNACRQDFDPNLFAKTVRDLDAREDILNTLYGNGHQDDMLKREHDMYQANGGTLSRADWMSKGKPDAASGRSVPKKEAGWFESTARNATRNPHSDKLVLGHYAHEGSSYQKVASHYEATYFKVENWNEVTKGLSQDEIWRINEIFLTQQLRQGKQVLFSYDPLKAKPGSFFEKEVYFMQELGYRFQQKNQWTWEAVR